MGRKYRKSNNSYGRRRKHSEHNGRSSVRRSEMAEKETNGKKAIMKGAKKFVRTIKRSYRRYKAEAPQRRADKLERLKYEAEATEQKARIAEARAKMPKPQMPSQANIIGMGGGGMINNYAQPEIQQRRPAPASQDFLPAPLQRGQIGQSQDLLPPAFPRRYGDTKFGDAKRKKQKPKGLDVDSFLRGQILG